MNCINTCSGMAVVEDFYGRRMTQCSLLKNLTFNQPFNVYTNDCKGQVEGSHPCDNYHYGCNSSTSLSLLVISTMVLVVSLLVLIFVRWLVLQHVLLKESCNIKLTKTRMQIIKDDRVIINKSILKLILYLILGIQLATSCITYRDQQGYIARSGDIICTSSGNLSVPTIEKDLILGKSYDSSTWQLVNSMSWGCAGGSCPSIEDCERTLSSNPNNLSVDLWTNEICYNIPGSCPFGRGCLYGLQSLHLLKFYSVYKILSISDKHINTLNKGNCSFDFISDESQILGDYSLVTNGREDWVCSTSGNLGSARFKLLGDIQIVNGKLLFPWLELDCIKDWYSTDCKIPSSYLMYLDEECLKLPSITPIGYLKRGSNGIGYIKISTESQAIKTDCDDVIIHNTSCKIISFQIWGVRSHLNGVYLTIQAQGGQDGSGWVVHGCLKTSQYLKCKMEINYLPISEEQYESCLKYKDVVDKTLTNNQHQLIEYSNSPSSGIVTIVNNMSSHHLLSALFSGSSIVIWIVIILLLIKR